MNDDISIPVSLPLDSDGFLRRECPSCEREFKWFQHPEGSTDAEHVEQYFCPLCGKASGVDTWWTPAQLEYIQGVAAPAVDQMFIDAVESGFKGAKGIDFTANRNWSRGVPTPEPLTEEDDMVIAEPPCHPHEPVKVPAEERGSLHCIVCGSAFAV